MRLGAGILVGLFLYFYYHYLRRANCRIGKLYRILPTLPGTLTILYVIPLLILKMAAFT